MLKQLTRLTIHMDRPLVLLSTTKATLRTGTLLLVFLITLYLVLLAVLLRVKTSYPRTMIYSHQLQPSITITIVEVAMLIMTEILITTLATLVGASHPFQICLMVEDLVHQVTHTLEESMVCLLYTSPSPRDS